MKKILNNIITVIAWIILAFALIVTILVFSSDRNNGVASLFGYVPLTVESDSMLPTFAKDDFIIDREIDDVYTLEEGDVITFWTLINGQRVKNTHRIIAVNNTGDNISFTTKGDNNDIKDSLNVYPVDIIGKWHIVLLIKTSPIIVYSLGATPKVCWPFFTRKHPTFTANILTIMGLLIILYYIKHFLSMF